MRYGKLTGSVMTYAPRAVTVGQTHYNPAPAEMLTEMGYLPVIDTLYPVDGNYYVSDWQEQDGQIIRRWIEAELPEEVTV